VTRSYYRGAVGALIVFDVTDRDTFLHLPSWLNDARTLAWSDVSIFIVGNKVDDEENREVTMLEAATFAQEHSSESRFVLSDLKHGF
jgi:GTPase SAR1 family protein